MVRKRRTELPGSITGVSSEALEAGGGCGGVQRTPAQQPQPQHHQGGGRGGWAPQRGAYGGCGGGGGGGRIGPQLYYGGPPDYQQGRGGQQYGREGAPRCGCYGGGRETPTVGGPI